MTIRTWIAATLAVAWLPWTRAVADGGCEESVAIVRLLPGASIANFNARQGTFTLRAIPARNLYLLALPSGTQYDEFEQQALGDPALLILDRQCNVTEENPGGSTQSIFLFSNPTAFWLQDATELIQADEARAITGGAGTTVAVVDSGISSHALLNDAVLAGGYDFVDRDSIPGDVGDGLDNDGDGYTDEFVGHGTAVAGLVHRLAPDADLLPVRVMNSDGFSKTFTLLEGIYFALDAGADVINVSMGATLPAGTLTAAVIEAELAGAIVVSAAGNDQTDNPPRYPAGSAPALGIGVAATDSADVRAPWSNFGTFVALTAPGVNVTSTLPGGLYGSASGTSFAAPLVSGTLALMKSRAPAATNAQLRQALLNSTDDISAQNPDIFGALGSGRLNALRAVQSACPGDVDLDGDADLADLSTLLTHFGQSTGMSYEDGDASGDGDVDLEDLAIVLEHFGVVCR